MRVVLTGFLAAAVGFTAATAALAKDVALLLVNERYESLPDVPGASDVLAIRPRLSAAGFEVRTLRNFRADAVGPLMQAARETLTVNDRILVIVAGHVVRNARDAWLLASDADLPDGFSVGQQGVSLGAIGDFAGIWQGRAVLAVGRSENASDVATGFGVAAGAGGIDEVSGVTLVEGSPADVARFVTDDLLVPGRSVADAARGADGVRVRGFVPRTIAFQSEPFGPTAADRRRAAWDEARAADSVAAYRAFLEAYPAGPFSDEARARIDELQVTPEDRARMTEDALGLNRNQRAAIQRDLTVLGFDTRGIDGIFGPATRQAVASWQRSIGVPDFGYLNANQISRLDAAAMRRREQLEAEAAARRAEAERQDRAFWARTGESGDEDALRRYLQRYPDGLFSEEARDALAAIERQNRREAAVAEREAWNRAVTEGTLRSYREYVAAYPEGRFIDEARERIRSLTEPETPADLVADARRQEEDLRLNAVSRRLIETRLAQLGYAPGATDGEFTDETRRAIRRYQRDNGILVTGYVTRLTVARLVTGALE